MTNAGYEVNMSTEYCPDCRKTCSMNEEKTVRTETDVDGKKVSIETASLHCEICSVFVRSVDKKLA